MSARIVSCCVFDALGYQAMLSSGAPLGHTTCCALLMGRGRGRKCLVCVKIVAFLPPCLPAAVFLRWMTAGAGMAVLHILHLLSCLGESTLHNTMKAGLLNRLKLEAQLFWFN